MAGVERFERAVHEQECQGLNASGVGCRALRASVTGARVVLESTAYPINNETDIRRLCMAEEKKVNQKGCLRRRKYCDVKHLLTKVETPIQYQDAWVVCVLERRS